MDPVRRNGNKLRWKFENVTKLDSAGMSSDSFSFHDSEWRIKIRVNQSGKPNFLAISLNYSSEKVRDKRWLCEVDAKVKLLTRSDNLTRNLRYCLHEKAKILEFPCFEEWEEVLFNVFPEKESVIIDVDLNYKYYDFSQKIANYTDIMVVVQNTEFYLNKGFLSSKSTYFYDRIVNNNNKNVDSLEINDMTVADFRFFLVSLQPCFNTNLDLLYEKLINLATKYGVPTIHQKCESYLISKSELQIIEKMKIADENDYQDLMMNCINSLKTRDEIKDLKTTLIFSELKDQTKLKIFYRLLDLL